MNQFAMFLLVITTVFVVCGKADECKSVNYQNSTVESCLELQMMSGCTAVSFMNV